MRNDHIFYVQGREPDPYEIRVKLNPLSISCTCAAAMNGTPCKHRIQLLNGNPENVVAFTAGSNEAISSIIETARNNGVMELLAEFDAAGKAEKNAGIANEKAFRSYRNEIRRRVLSETKTDKSITKATTKLNESTDKWIEAYAIKEQLRKSLHDTVFSGGSWHEQNT